MLIAEDGLWIGTTASSCHAARRGAELDDEWARSELNALKQMYPESCPPALELASEFGAYQEVIHIMDISVQVGWIDVGLSGKSELAVALPTKTARSHCIAPRFPPPLPPPAPAERQAVLDLPEHRSQELIPGGLELPEPRYEPAVQRAPVIIVTKTEVSLAGKTLAPIASVPRSGRFPALFSELERVAEQIKRDLAAGALDHELVKACAEAKRGIRPQPGRICPVGLAILQADESTDVHVINTIVSTAKAAGFDNLLFAVKNK